VSVTQYVAVDGAAVAYRIAGDGAFDLLFFFRLGGHVDAFFDEPAHSVWRRGLMSFSRLIAFDRRGLGAADRPSDVAVASPEEGARDALTVLDAVGSERAVLFAGFDAGPAALQLAASHPERVEALVLANTFARFLAAGDHPIGAPANSLRWIERSAEHLWGTENVVPWVAGASGDFTVADRKARQLRSSATPRAAAAQLREVLEVDVRSLLPRIQAPTLVLHLSDNPFVPVTHGRHLADNIPGARLVELPGDSIDFASDQVAAVIDEMATFVTGRRPAGRADRVVTTLLFSDIVDSTPHAAALGDSAWRGLLDAHDRRMRQAIRQFGGHVVNTTGDGFLASFASPADAVRSARAMHHAIAELGLAIRVGIHTGVCDDRDGNLSGIAVHIAARVAAAAAAGQVLVTDNVLNALDTSGLRARETVNAELKGVPGSWRLSALEE
jgi:class 3 adenylate cyclase